MCRRVAQVEVGGLGVFDGFDWFRDFVGLLVAGLRPWKSEIAELSAFHQWL